MTLGDATASHERLLPHWRRPRVQFDKRQPHSRALPCQPASGQRSAARLCAGLPLPGGKHEAAPELLLAQVELLHDLLRVETASDDGAALPEALAPLLDGPPRRHEAVDGARRQHVEEPAPPASPDLLLGKRHDNLGGHGEEGGEGGT
eukprot:5129848-Prymnesium_polylepis.1